LVWCRGQGQGGSSKGEHCGDIKGSNTAAAAFTTRILGEVPAVTWDGRWLAGRPDGYGRDDDDGRSTGPAIDLAPTGRRAAEFDQLRGP